MIDDEQVVQRLRQAYAAEAAPQINPATALRAGRRWRRRRQVARWSGVAVASVVGLGLGAGLVGGWGPSHDQTVAPATEEMPEFVAPTVLDAYDGVPAGVPDSWGPNGRFDPGEGQTVIDLETRTVTLWTSGSSGCPTPPKAIRGYGDTVEIVVGMPDGITDCRANLAWVTYVIAFPSDFAPGAVSTVDVIHQQMEADADRVPAVMPPRGASPCLPALTVCAMNRWLNEMLTAAGLQSPASGSDVSVNAGALVQVGGGEIAWRLFPLSQPDQQLPMTVLRTNDVGAVVVEHGTQSDNPEAEFTCGGFRIEAQPGYATDADLLAQTVDAVAATITECPADLDELIARYPDLSPP